MTTLTLQLPDPLYSRLKKRAEQSERTVEAETLELLATAVPTADELSPDLAEAVAQLALLDDAALWQAARCVFPQESAAHLEQLLRKQQREGLSVTEAQTLAHLIRQYERTMLVRAQAAALLRQRGHDISKLAVSA